MKFKKVSMKFLFAAIAASACYFPIAEAFPVKSLAQTCELGSTCPVPGNDGGQTVYKVTPSSGLNYVCEVKSDAGSLKFSITPGKDFKMTHGGGLYNANPSAKVEINGRFENPNNQDDTGEIRITKMPLSADGNVTCYVKK
ncbi:MAG: hypothetical protein H0W64_02540 [Gammaproteobacteria bacterium]|nr:hypothetical protein [Gammaproteobacteria bacterium]